MKKYLILILFSFSAICLAQSRKYQVVYDLEQVAKTTSFKIEVKAYLEGNGLISIYEEDFEHAQENSDTDENTISIKGKNNTFFKDFKKNTLYLRNHIKFKFFTIKDTINKFNWELQEETKTILGYACQKAICTFRGRMFEVYFTKDLPFSDGPWKFSGLPGLILEAYSNDEIASLHFIANNVKISEIDKDYINPYADEKYIRYNDFVKIYNKKYEEALHKTDEYGFTYPMLKGFREYYVD